jgi:hypothetical protein
MVVRLHFLCNVERMQNGHGSTIKFHDCLGVNCLLCEDNNEPPSGAHIKNAWSYTSSLWYIFMPWCLIRHKDSLAISLYIETNELLMSGPGQADIFYSLQTYKLVM